MFEQLVDLHATHLSDLHLNTSCRASIQPTIFPASIALRGKSYISVGYVSYLVFSRVALKNLPAIEHLARIVPMYDKFRDQILLAVWPVSP